MYVSITISGEKQLSRYLRDVELSMAEWREAITGSIELVQKRSEDIFNSEGSIVEKAGGVWPGLAASTKRAREKRWGYYKQAPSGGGKILSWTGNLKNSKVKEIEKKTGLFGFTASYAGYHQNGSGNRPPKRAILDLDQRTIHNIEEIFKKQCIKKLQDRPFIN